MVDRLVRTGALDVSRTRVLMHAHALALLQPLGGTDATVCALLQGQYTEFPPVFAAVRAPIEGLTALRTRLRPPRCLTASHFRTAYAAACDPANTLDELFVAVREVLAAHRAAHAARTPRVDIPVS